VLSAFALVLILNYSCADHDFGSPFFVDCTTAEEYSYVLDVSPVIAENCATAGCHDGSTWLPDWTDINNLQNIDHQKEIKRRITLPLTDGEKMPREGSITAVEREKIYCWIEQGAKDN